MKRFILRRCVMAVPLILAITLFTFLLMYACPGNFVTQLKSDPDVSAAYVKVLERQYGLDQAWYVQYWLWLKNCFRGDFGVSWIYNLPVLSLFKQRVLATLMLALFSFALGWIIAIPCAIVAAYYRDNWFNKLFRSQACLCLCLPEFFVALLAVWFATQTGWFPTIGRTSLNYENLSTWGRFLDLGWHLILPSCVLSLGIFSNIFRLTYNYFLDHLRDPYVLTVQAKGVAMGAILFKHTLRNALNPLITHFGFAFANLLSGAVLVENIFNYPGLGQLLYEAFMNKDQYVVMGAIVLGSILLILGNLLADILLALNDPRLRH